MTLYLELGGRIAIRRGVLAVLRNSQPDARGTAEELTEFLVFLFGGAPVYEGPALHETVSSFCLGNAGYDRLVEDLTRALTGTPASAALAQDVRATLEQVRCHAVRGPLPVSLSAAAVPQAHSQGFI